MLFSVIKKLETFEEASLSSDGIEVRFDLFESIPPLSTLSTYVKKANLLFTVRKASHGGGFTRSEEERLQLIEALFSLEPAFFDVEYDTDPAFIAKMATAYPRVKIILSYHDFTKTPDDLFAFFMHMRSPYAHAYKIAALALSSLDALRMLLLIKKASSLGYLMSAISMGDPGQFARVLFPIMGGYINYAPPKESEATAPGQLTMETLLDTYNYRKVSPSTRIYGLIGNPVDKSVSHIMHNYVMRSLDIDAVYVKFLLKEEELSSFFSLIKELPIKGLSVTMPFKESVFPFLDEIDNEAKIMRSVNTIVMQGNKRIGYNTDGLGALDAIEKFGAVQGKKCIVLGAGGAARAIIYTALKRGALVTTLNRTVANAKLVASELGGSFGALEECALTKDYDIIINCTPDPMPISEECFLPNAIFMDIKTLPQYTPFLIHAKEIGALLVFGYQMLINQGARQLALWEIDKQEAVEPLLSSSLEDLFSIDFIPSFCYTLNLS